ncbi:hypothetical protein Cgig2_023824 [Carnegiea gigantea]|uniref:Uncharacterized protein n=1 Tax=Carnegiea gigantea TaxID=171969 RepID=A0A9Q1K9D8_9CARY|nr:hypothetical protein Cgig2_023824 [Carnegiea gigantea]
MKSRPSRKSNDLKSWTWMLVMHPELNYSAGFQKNWFQWKQPFGNVSIKKWVKETKEKRKDQKRLQKAEVHAAVTIAGLAAALAAIAEENSKGKLELEHEESPSRKDALASAAAIVASQCALVAHSLGATRGQLSNVISSALSGTSTSDILTLTAAGSTSLRGVATLKGRAGFNRALNGAPVLPIEMDNSLVLDLQAELYEDSAGDEYDTCYQIVLTTTRGTIKLDMADDYQRYKMWATTINQMLKLSPSHTKYELQFCKC